MNKESLNKALEIIIKEIDKSSIDNQDKAELMLNLFHFLEPNQYEENIKVLRKEKRR